MLAQQPVAVWEGHAIFSDLKLPLSNPDFKVTQIFDVEYGIDGTK